MINGDFPKYLLNKSKGFGESAYNLIVEVLKPHDYLSERRAQEMLEIVKKYYGNSFFTDVCNLAIEKEINLPKALKFLFEEAETNKYQKDL